MRGEGEGVNLEGNRFKIISHYLQVSTCNYLLSAVIPEEGKDEETKKEE